MPKKRQLFIRLSVASVLLIAIIVSIRLFIFPGKPTPAYLTATAVRGDLQDTVLANGVVKASKLVNVGAQASGQIKSLRVALGDHVKKGQVIAELDSSTQKNVLRSAQADLIDLQAQLEARQALNKQNQLAFDRQKAMLAQDASARANYEQAEAALLGSRANIAALRAQLDKSRIAVDTAQVTLGYTSITAPIDGTVVAIVAQEGQTVNAAQSTPTIVTLADMSTVQVKIQISEADVIKVRQGQPAFFTVLGEPDHQYRTTLGSVEPAPESISQNNNSSSSGSTPSAVYYNGLLDMPNADGKLRISMTAQVNIILNEVKNALLIPTISLDVNDRDNPYTIKVLNKDGETELRKIKIGLRTTASTQVLEGLSAGEKVIIGEAGAASGKTADNTHSADEMIVIGRVGSDTTSTVEL